MNTFYVWGPILDGDGLAMWQRPDGLDIEVCPADGGLADEQPERIPVHLRHRGPVIGEVVGLEHVHGQVMVLAEVDFDRIDRHDLPANVESAAWYWSASIQRGPGSTVRSRGRSTPLWTVAQGTLDEVSLTESPVSLLRPVRSTRNRPSRQSFDQWQRRAAETIEQRRRDPSAPLRIIRLDERGQPITQHPATHRPGRMRTYHSASVGRVLSVT